MPYNVPGCPTVPYGHQPIYYPYSPQTATPVRMRLLVFSLFRSQEIFFQAYYATSNLINQENGHAQTATSSSTPLSSEVPVTQLINDNTSVPPNTAPHHASPATESEAGVCKTLLGYLPDQLYSNPSNMNPVSFEFAEIKSSPTERTWQRECFSCHRSILAEEKGNMCKRCRCRMKKRLTKTRLRLKLDPRKVKKIR
jgi:hypothetical protein